MSGHETLAGAAARLGYGSAVVAVLPQEWANAGLQHPRLTWSVGTRYGSDGVVRRLIKVAGLLAMPRPAADVPVCVWIPTGYPDEPPSCQVEPPDQQTQLVPNHPSLELGGVVIVKGWRKECTLTTFLDELRMVFSRTPPLRRARPPATLSTPTTPYRSMLAVSGRDKRLSKAETLASLNEHLRSKALRTREESAVVAAQLETHGARVRLEIKAAELAIERMTLQTAAETAKTEKMKDRLAKGEAWVARNVGKVVHKAADLQPSDPLSCQVLEVEAEYEMCADYLRLLDGKLAAGILGPDAFVAAVLRTAAQQFRAQALLNKIARVQQQLRQQQAAVTPPSSRRKRPRERDEGTPARQVGRRVDV
ncbi:hypothetical protein DIPPA_09509 [Diplonema papillatum]|nr:hypothetical protein DIPPA_09509 [Diplonema papillatum]|eukprot:gene9571-14856_t